MGEREAADRRVASRASSLERSRASGARERRALRAENEALRAQIQACAQLMRSQDTQSETPVSILVACVALLFFALLLSLFAYTQRRAPFEGCGWPAPIGAG